MKKMILMLIVVFLTSGIWSDAGAQLPFYRPVKHKTVKRMTRKQVRKAQNGKNFYVRKKGQMKKNL